MGVSNLAIGYAHRLVKGNGAGLAASAANAVRFLNPNQNESRGKSNANT